MRNSIKRLSVAFFALSVSIPALAANSSPFDVSIPNQQGGFSFGADALYMRATAPNLGYSAAFNSIDSAGGTSLVFPGTQSGVNTTYQWGFDAMLGYRFPGTGNDIMLSWMHLGNFNNSNTTSFLFPLTSTIDDAAEQFGNVQFNYNAVDLDLGQKVNFGDYFNFRMFAGARWADVKEQINNVYSSAIFEFSEIASQYQNSEFKGVGPQIGFDGRYCLGYGFGIDANVTASLLVGDIDTTANINAVGLFDNIIDSVSNDNLDNENRDRVVPALDANLGLDYTYAFANCDRSYVTIEAGYRAINYFEVTQNINSHTVYGPLPTDFSGSFTLGNTASSVGFDGPYVGINVNL